MPSLGADMEAGTLVRWLVSVGDSVKRGDIVAEVETDKADMEIETFESGVIERILVGEGEKVAVGTPLALIGEGGEVEAAKPRERVAPPPPEPERKPPAKAEAPPEPPAVSPAPHRPRITPAARVLATKLGVDLDAVEGSGVHGAVTRADVERSAGAPPQAAPPPPPARRSLVSPLARRTARDLGVDLATVTGTGRDGAITNADIRRAAAGEAPKAPSKAVPEAPRSRDEERAAARQRAIAALMDRSKREIPHYYLALGIDLSRATVWLERENAARSVAQRILPSALLLKAVARAAHEAPEMNGTWEDGALHAAHEVNLGVAVSLRSGGLLAPAIPRADELSLSELMAALRDLVQRARTGKLRASEMSGATITVTNLGDQGAQLVQGVIYPPQVALVGFGRVGERPWAADGMLGVRTAVTATLSADHRASDGHRGSRFLAAIDHLLQEPERL